jgi:hypothetical protein
MIAIALLASIIQPVVLVWTTWVLVMSPRIGVAAKNSIATGSAAAVMVLVFFGIYGVYRHGPWAEIIKDGWEWRVPMFSALAACFAWTSGWSAASLYLALRQTFRGLWHRPGCPSPLHTAIALVVLLSLIVFYVELLRDVAAAITDKHLMS